MPNNESLFCSKAWKVLNIMADDAQTRLPIFPRKSNQKVLGHVGSFGLQAFVLIISCCYIIHQKNIYIYLVVIWTFKEAQIAVHRSRLPALATWGKCSSPPDGMESGAIFSVTNTVVSHLRSLLCRVCELSLLITNLLYAVQKSVRSCMTKRKTFQH